MCVKECKKCGACCKSISGEEFGVIIFPNEILNLCSCLNLTQAEFVSKYCIRRIIQISKTEKYDVILLKMINSHCVFLTEDNLCSIYNFRPLQCEKAPYEFFAHDSLWKHMPCLNYKKLSMCDSSKSDKELVRDLLNGYSDF